MNILITGGSGFLGTALTQALQHDKATVTWVSRKKNTPHPTGVKILTYQDLATTTERFDIIVNLAGAGIADSRWTAARKRQLLDSRLQPTQAVLDYIARAAVKPQLLISGSAIGWYGAYSSAESATVLDESSPPRDEFQHQLCQQWEQLALHAQQYGVAVAIVRTGVVIAPDGGMVARLRLPFKMGLGGKLADGQQMMSWISRADWVRAVQFIISLNAQNNNAIKGLQPSTAPQIYNLTAPQPVANADFTRAMGQRLHRPTCATLPKIALTALFGEMATLLINGQTVVPTALLQQGFEFKQQAVLAALRSQE